MIRGICSPYASPYISGFVYFPPPVDQMIEVPFLVDTGAAFTTLHLTDLIKLGPRIRDLPLEPFPMDLRTVGGTTVRPTTTLCAIAFPHDTGGFTRFLLNPAMFLAAQSLGTAALLGMDVLSSGRLSVMPQDGSVLFDAPAGQVFRVPAPGSPRV